jgi:hypothetical protein
MKLQETFKESFNGVDFEFCRVFYPGKLKYKIHLVDPSSDKKYDLHLIKDEGNLWKIESQILPDFIWDLESAFSDTINLNERRSVIGPISQRREGPRLSYKLAIIHLDTVGSTDQVSASLPKCREQER